MNIQHLRQSLKVKWLLYYQQNRPWLVKLRIWGTYDQQRRPSSSFILAVLSTMDPQITHFLPFIVDLSNNPDQIVAALGLNFNPDEELKSMAEAIAVAEINGNGNGNGLTETNGAAEKNGNGNGLSVEISPKVKSKVITSPSTQASNLPSMVDESCYGKGSPNSGLVLSILAVIGSLAVVVVTFSG